MLGPESLRTVEGFWHERFWLRSMLLSCLSTGQTAVVDIATLRIGDDLIGFDDVLKGRRALRLYPIMCLVLAAIACGIVTVHDDCANTSGKAAIASGISDQYTAGV